MASKQPTGAKQPQRNNAIVPNALLSQYSYGSEEKQLQVVELKRHLFSRLLYTNPVCLLTTSTNTVPATLLPSAETTSSDSLPGSSSTLLTSPSPSPSSPSQDHHHEQASISVSISPPLRNVMAITWLTATTNHGDFIASMNNTRYSAHLMKATRRFVLNVPVAGMEEMIRSIGRCSGKDGDKFDRLSIPLCAPGWKPLPSCFSTTPSTSLESSSSSSMRSSHSSPSELDSKEQVQVSNDTSNTTTDIAIPSCVAHMLCEVVRILEDQVDGHLLLIGKVTSAFVRSDYWGSANFIAQCDQLPPYLTFLGGGHFGYVERTPHITSQPATPINPSSS